MYESGNVPPETGDVAALKKHSPSPRPAASLWTYFVAPTAITAAPLFQFLSGNNYPVFTPEVGLLLAYLSTLGLLCIAIASLGARLVAALIIGVLTAISIDIMYQLDYLYVTLIVSMTLAWLLRSQFSMIVSIAGLVLIGTTIGMSHWNSDSAHRTDSPVAAKPGEDAPPVILHILADEFAGLIGLPLEIKDTRELRHELKNHFMDRGFTIYSHAYSEFYDSKNSIPNFLNFAAKSTSLPFLHAGKSRPFILHDSQYFKQLAKSGYLLNVYQSQYMDFCQVPNVEFNSCLTYGGFDIDVISRAEIPTIKKGKAIAVLFMHSSPRLSHAGSTLIALPKPFEFLQLPRWTIFFKGGANALASIEAIPQLVHDLKSATPGQAYFVHLLLPHYPYVFDSQCKPEPRVAMWLNRYPEMFVNDEESRKVRYQAYSGQVRCTLQLLDQLFAALKESGNWDDARIIVHGDHGSRITLHDPPSMKKLDILTDQDFRDSFSTFFAVRTGDAEAEIVFKPLSVQDILASTVGLVPEATKPHVYLHKIGHQFEPVPLQGFDLPRE